MFGIPGAVGGVFVYNLKTDDEFYSHFNDRYPDLIAAINEYIPLDETELLLASREDIGPVGSSEDLLNETVTVVVELQSRQKVQFQVQGSASQQEIEALALKHAAQPNDRVVAVTFAEEGDAEEGDAEEENATTPALTTQAAWPPAPRVTWGSAAPKKDAKKSIDSVKEIQLQIDEIRAQQATLEESKYAGRDIDEADEEIAALEERKIVLKEQLPRKRFLYIF
ncbi:hypothetical protein JM18_006145 [Phytophthora kernoviae]|uniref:Uncharacterized protein n=1 Tax=Phytophthora kernoviae TaxID=325452 RepID=A0A8T0LTX8_9STRA|nr:hypothetical protein JM16_006279 [Phytophthora kernoviae]KAG2522434.1 hypothetical protein JM18_006145 [Phytophthora kernoviae]